MSALTASGSFEAHVDGSVVVRDKLRAAEDSV